MKPPFAYFGGKTMIAERITPLLPPHSHYVEPYCGSLSVLLAKPPAKMETVNDLDHELMTWWRVLRDRPEDLARACALTPHSRAEYMAARERGLEDELEVARRVWVMLSQGRGLTLREGKTGWKHYVYPTGSSVGMPGYLEAYVERIAAAAARLSSVSLECMPALDLIAKYGAEPDVLLYVDPPYLGTTRDHRNNYRHEMKADVDHRELAEALHACKAAVVLSGYASDLYDRELYAGWDRHTMAAFTGNSGGDGKRMEVLWSNRPLGAQPSLLDAFNVPA
ncbi:DNA adenine methylase [Micromonospora sp. NPDC047753]|uniref:DNA adenine methylase n=1 Tax=Micromonospora sp. NPDC047753 TaxID=3154817 RepID=UPI0033EEAC83